MTYDLKITGDLKSLLGGIKAGDQLKITRELLDASITERDYITNGLEEDGNFEFIGVRFSWTSVGLSNSDIVLTVIENNFIKLLTDR